MMLPLFGAAKQVSYREPLPRGNPPVMHIFNIQYRRISLIFSPGCRGRIAPLFVLKKKDKYSLGIIHKAGKRITTGTDTKTKTV